MLGLVWLGHFSYRAWQFKTLFAPDKIVENFRTPHRMFGTNLIRKKAPAFELEEMWQALPKEFSYDGETIAIVAELLGQRLPHLLKLECRSFLAD